MSVVIFGLLVIISYLIIKPFLLAILLGALLAYALYPFNRLLKKRLNKTFAALLVCLLVLILIIIPSVFFVKTLIQESYSIYVLGKQKLSVGLFSNCENTFCNWISELSEKPEVKYYFQEGLKGLTNWIIKKGSDFLTSIPNFLLNLFILFFALFYFLKDGAIFSRKVSLYLSMQKRRYGEVIGRLKEITHGIIYGYLLVALIQGALGAIGFFIFGVSSPLFWGIVMAFLALIPYLGTGIIWGPAALILFLDGIFRDSSWLMYKGIGLAIYGLIVISGVDNLIRPKLIGDKAKIHPAIVLVGILGGILLIGPAGVIIGPLVLSLTVIIVQLYLGNKKRIR